MEQHNHTFRRWAKQCLFENWGGKTTKIHALVSENFQLLLKKQEEFRKLPKSFVIFISENDVIGEDEKIYHIDRIVRETGKDFGDGTHIIYVNGSFKDEERKPLDDLIHDFFCANPAEMRHKQLANRVSFLKENKGDVGKMSNIIAEIFKDEIAEAAPKAAVESKEKNLIENIRSLMETLNFTAQQSMDALKIPANEQEKYLALI